MGRFEWVTSGRPRVRSWRVVAVLGLLVGLLGMHALAPGGGMPGAHEHQRVREAVAVVAGDGCSGDDGHCGGGHVRHADATCASAAVSGGPVLPAPVADPGPVVVPDDAVCAYVGAAPDGARAPPSLAELQLLRI
ncbi:MULTISPECIES: DUF6153 family protein [unclassified Streptomyces]|uniref:DUF6153 family protein n=1 Tax=unclassified Streptomyces TaxID=2593676 RepID=UPI00345568EF